MKSYCLDVRGPFACFTRPEMKVERVSYDVITPSAARAIFETILWKPAIRWEVTRIEVLNPIRWINLRRNEVGAKASVRNIERAMAAGSGDLGLYVEDERQQRAGLFLRDVAYRLHATLHVLDLRTDQSPRAKFHAMFERRAGAGQCVNQPYLGCREFAADVRLVTDASGPPSPIAESRDLGYMLHDMVFSNENGIVPRFFRAEMVDGVITVPPFKREGVLQ